MQQRRLQLHLQAEAHPPLFVLADPRRLRQVMLNLLSNAIKYNSPQGMIRLGYEVRAGGVLRLWVDDSGRGSARAAGAAVPAVPASGAGELQHPGTGIGLVLCRELAELMNGEMGFSSDVGLGSRFWIELPSAAEPAPAAEVAGAPATESATALAGAVRGGSSGLPARIAGSAARHGGGRGMGGTSALLQLAEQTPALLLLDLDLPDGSGLEVLDFTRVSRAWPRCRCWW